MNEFGKMKVLKPVLLDLDPCNHKPINVAAQEITERAATYALESDGSLLLAHGVLQDFGVTIALTKKSDAIPFWRSQANLDDYFQVQSLSNNPYIDPAGIPFKKGDTITISLAFNNPTDKWSKNATAGAIVYLYE